MTDMTRSEIVRLALEKSTNLNEVMIFAKEVSAFIAGEQAPIAEPVVVEPAPVVTKQRMHVSIYWNERRRFTADDLKTIEKLYDSGLRPKEIGPRIGRSPQSVSNALCGGLAKPKTYEKSMTKSEATKLAYLERVTKPDHHINGA